MRFAMVFSLFFLACPALAQAQTALSFQKLAEQQLIPYFTATQQEPKPLGEARFPLYEQLDPARREFLESNLLFDANAQQMKLKGAVMNFKTDHLRLKDGSLHKLPNRTVNDRLAIAHAAFGNGYGVAIDFSPLPYKAYFAPMSYSHLRAFTLSPDGTVHDKSYTEICEELASVKNADFYFMLLDFSIRGQFDNAVRLAPKEQELLVDIISIAMAEHYLQLRLAPYARTAPFTGPLYNLAIDMPFINHGAWQYAKDGNPIAGQCDYYLNGYTAKKDANYKNSLLITRALQQTHAYDMAVLASKSKGVTLHEMAAYFAAHPDNYDEAVQLSLKRVMEALPSLAAKVNSLISAQ